jgi:hypothetical protein
MWTSATVALGLLSLVPHQTKKLELTHARFTYGLFGMERPNSKFLRGDFLLLVYDVKNAKADKKTGKVEYRILMELVDGKGNLIFSRKNRIEAINAFGGNTQPAYAHVNIGTDQKPGKYTIKIKVTDVIGKQTATLKKDFQVLKAGFGFVRVKAPVVSFIGPTYPIEFTVVGFKRDKKGFPHVRVDVDILDIQGKKVLIKTKSMSIPGDLDKDIRAQDITDLPFPLSFVVNRKGKYTIRVKARDEIADKTVKLEYKITVLDPRDYESGK